jgi:hypothetical protein
MLEQWNARRKGRADGHRASPGTGDPECKYLVALKSRGERRIARLGLLWRWADLALYPMWARAVVRQHQAEVALERARLREDEAHAAWSAKKTVKHKSLLRRAVQSVSRLWRRVNAAQTRAVRARARRQSVFEYFQGRYGEIATETRSLMSLYVDANLAHREDDLQPAALMAKNWPELFVPSDLAVLTWRNPLARWDQPVAPPSASI